MDASAIESAVRLLGAERISVHGTKVQCTCLLAPWTHRYGRDASPSMVLFTEGKYGDPIYSCLGCHERGSLRDLLCFMWMKTGQSTLHWIDQIDGESSPIGMGDFSGAKRKLADLDFAAVRAKRLATKIGDVTERGGKWFDYMAIAKADNVEIIPDERYAEFAGHIPRYALSRGFTVETCKEWELGHDAVMKRLLFPMRNRKGQLVAISGRLYACPKCGNEGVKKVKGERDRCAGCDRGLPPKYLHSAGFKRNLFLYGESRQKDGNGHVYVVEGNLDAPLMWQAGYWPVVAMLGSAPGPTQIEKLVAWWDSIIVVGDGDQAGSDMGAKIKEMVAGRVSVKVCDLPAGSDPGSLATEDPQILADILGDPRATVDKPDTMG